MTWLVIVFLGIYATQLFSTPSEAVVQTTFVLTRVLVVWLLWFTLRRPGAVTVRLRHLTRHVTAGLGPSAALVCITIAGARLAGVSTVDPTALETIIIALDTLLLAASCGENEELADSMADQDDGTALLAGECLSVALVLITTGDVLCAVLPPDLVMIGLTAWFAGAALSAALIVVFHRGLLRPGDLRQVAPGPIASMLAPRFVVLAALVLSALVRRPPLLLVASVVIMLAAIVYRLSEADRYNSRLWRSLSTQANIDAVTRLSKRQQLLNTVNDLDPQTRIEVLYLDLVGFREVNGAYGHQTGDRVLRRVAEHLTRLAPAGAMIARIGGDEFTVVCATPPKRPSSDSGDLKDVGGRLISELAADPTCYSVGLNAGLAVGPVAEIETLLQNADLAMYAGRRTESQVTVTYKPWMRARTKHRAIIGQRLSAAAQGLDPTYPTSHTGGLVLMRQPIYELSTQELWGHATRPGYLDQGEPTSPPELLSVAGEIGLLDRVTRWTLGEALRWRAAFSGAGSVSVSLGASDVQPGMDTSVLRELRRADLPGDVLVLDIAPDTDPRRVAAAGPSLRRLRQHGVRIALDDYGIGPMFLGQLTDLHVDILKIAPPFTAIDGRDPRPSALLGSALGLARQLGLTVAAKGVDHIEQARTLQSLGCHLAQGPLFNRMTVAQSTPQTADRPTRACS